MGSTTNQGVGCVGQSVEHILTDEPALFSLHKRLQEVVDHLGVHGSFKTKVRKITVSPTKYMIHLLNKNVGTG